MSGAPNAKEILNEETKQGLLAARRWIKLLEKWMDEPEFKRLPEKTKAEQLAVFMQADRDLKDPLAAYARLYRENLPKLNGAMG